MGDGALTMQAWPDCRDWIERMQTFRGVKLAQSYDLWIEYAE